MNGNISVTSVVDHGTTFSVEIPYAPGKTTHKEK
jgi:signal transduction histidine kinase